jgi:hypothetical protein
LRGLSVEREIVVVSILIPLIVVGFFLYNDYNHVGFGFKTPLQRVELSTASFDNVNNAVTVNATLTRIDIDQVGFWYRRMYYEVKEPFVFYQAKIYSAQTLLATINLTQIELSYNTPATTTVNLDNPLASGDYSIKLITTNDWFFVQPFIIP